MTLPLQIIHQMNEQLKQFVLQVFVRVSMLWLFRLPLEALVAKTATREQKASCVLRFAKTESVIRVKRVFCIKFHCNPPSDNIRRWYHQFEDTGSFCKGNSSGRPSMIEEHIKRVSDAFALSQEIVQRASFELTIPVMSVWRILWRRLQLRPYRLQLLQALKPADYAACAELGYRLDVCHVTKGAHIEHL